MKTATALALALSLGAGDAFCQSHTGNLSSEDVREVSPHLKLTPAKPWPSDCGPVLA
jgi:hypothetical protein